MFNALYKDLNLFDDLKKRYRSKVEYESSIASHSQFEHFKNNSKLTNIERTIGI